MSQRSNAPAEMTSSPTPGKNTQAIDRVRRALEDVAIVFGAAAATLVQLQNRRRWIERPSPPLDQGDLEEQAARKSGSSTVQSDRAFHGRTEINLVLSRLPDDLRTLADQLCWMDLDEIARLRGISRTWLHRLKRRLRRAFIAAGVMPAGWDPSTDRRKKRSA